MQLVKDMAFLVNHLMDERGAGSKHVEPQEDPRWFMEQWEQFRALVNTREPKPASPEFLKVQDRVLQLMVAEPGITEVDELARTASDPRLSIWRGDITALRCDAIVNAANSALLGCWIPGHLCIDNAIHTFAGEGVDGVVDAQMPGNPAAQKRAVRGVDDGVAAQGRDVPAPDAQARVGGGARKLVDFGDARFGNHELENAVLHLQKLRRSGLRLARVHQRAELLPLLHEPARVLLRLNVLAPRAPLVHQVIHQKGHILYQLHHGVRVSFFASPSCRAGRWRRARALRRPRLGISILAG